MNDFKTNNGGTLFSSSVLYLLYTTLLTSILVGLFLYIIDEIIYIQLYLPMGITNILKPIMAIVVGVAWTLLYCNINIMVDDEGLHFYRNGKNYLNIAHDKIESVNTHTTWYVCIPIIDRSVKYDVGKRYKTVKCHCFAEKDLHEMLDLINVYRRENAASQMQQ